MIDLLNKATDVLDTLPTIELILVSILFTIVALVVTGLIARRMPLDSPSSEAATDAYKIIVTFTAILLSFTLVQAMNNMKAAEALVSREGNAINQLDRLLIRYQTPGTAVIRPLLVTYVKSIITEDWPAMRNGVATDKPNLALAPLNRAITTLDGGLPIKPQLYTEMLRQLDVVNDSRQERIDSADAGVSQVIWSANAALCLLLLVLSALIRMPARLVAIGGHAIAIAILLSITYAVDQPFRGQEAVAADPIIRVLTSILARTS
jgi:hypothetical protein